MSREKWENMKRFTMIFHGGNGYGVRLHIKNQYFTVTPIQYETMQEAEWMQTQLCKALVGVTDSRIKELEEAVKWACAYMSNSHDLNIKNYVEPELRRKAGKEG
jgi:hypothetical protein